MVVRVEWLAPKRRRAPIPRCRRVRRIRPRCYWSEVEDKAVDLEKVDVGEAGVQDESTESEEEVAEHSQPHECRLRSRRKGRHRTAERLKAATSRFPNVTCLEAASVSKNTLQDYKMHFGKFLDWAIAKTLPLKSAEQVDAAMVLYFNEK